MDKLYNAGLRFDVNVWQSGFGWYRLPGPYQVLVTYNGKEVSLDTWIHPQKKFASLYTDVDPGLTYAIGRQALPGEEYDGRISLVQKAGRASSDDVIRICSDTGDYLDVIQGFDWSRAQSVSGYVNIDGLIRFVKSGSVDSFYSQLGGTLTSAQSMVEAYRQMFIQVDTPESKVIADNAREMLRSAEAYITKRAREVDLGLFVEFVKSIYPVSETFGNVRLKATTLKWSTKRVREVAFVGDNEFYQKNNADVRIRDTVNIDDGSVITT